MLTLTRDQRIGIAAIIVMIILAAVAVINPEIRRFVHLDKESPRTEAQPSPKLPANPSTLTSETSDPSNPASKSGTSRQTKATVKGNGNVTGNNVSGKSNVTGNNNQTGSTAIAPNGIAITGGNVSNPTVNNYGPPPVELRWTISDLEPQTDFPYNKAITIRSNAYYSPVYIAIFCDAEIESANATGISMGVATGSINGDKKVHFLRMAGPPITPESPLTVVLNSKNSFKVLRVSRIETQQ